MSGVDVLPTMTTLDTWVSIAIYDLGLGITGPRSMASCATVQGVKWSLIWAPRKEVGMWGSGRCIRHGSSKQPWGKQESSWLACHGTLKPFQCQV